MNQKGRLIVFEGADGVGKSTVIEAAARFLHDRSIPYVLTKDPGGTALGDAIREEMFRKFKITNMAPGVVDCLMLASHMQVTHDVIIPTLQGGGTVLADRYWYSEAPYAAVRRPRPPIPILEAYQELHGPSADILFLLTVSPAKIADRNKTRPDAARQLTKSWDKIEDQVLVQKEFLRLYSSLPECVHVDADRAQSDVIEQVLDKMSAKFIEWGMTL